MRRFSLKRMLLLTITICILSFPITAKASELDDFLEDNDMSIEELNEAIDVYQTVGAYNITTDELEDAIYVYMKAREYEITDSDELEEVLYRDANFEDIFHSEEFSYFTDSQQSAIADYVDEKMGEAYQSGKSAVISGIGVIFLIIILLKIFLFFRSIL